MGREVVRTAPKRIWLQVDIDGAKVEYARADFVEPHLPGFVAECLGQFAEGACYCFGRCIYGPDRSHRTNAPIDVLAVMNRACECMNIAVTNSGDNRLKGINAEIREARNAVAELIEAAEYAYPPGDYSQDMHGYAVRAALARCGGAK